MKLKHKIKINIADRNGHKQEVLQSEHRSIPEKVAHLSLRRILRGSRADAG